MKYEDLPYASIIPKQRLEKLLQEFATKQANKSFRFFGDSHDFFHGHLVSEKLAWSWIASPRKPVAILWHTQEDAFQYYFWQKYSYINKHARNWIQWVEEPSKIENAIKYEVTPTPREFEYARQVHYTIHSPMLDPHLMSMDSIAELDQVSFFETSCLPGQHEDITQTNYSEFILPDPIRKKCVLFMDVCSQDDFFNTDECQKRRIDR